MDKDIWNKVLHTLERKVYGANEYLFGRCVREIAEGKFPNHLEIFASSKDAFAENSYGYVIHRIRAELGAGEISEATSETDTKFGLKRRRLRLRYEGEDFTFDVVYAKESPHGNHPFHGTSVDVNLLLCRSINYIGGFGDCDSSAIKKIIAKRQFKIIRDSDRTQYDRLIESGYTLINKKNDYEVGDSVYVKIGSDGRAIDTPSHPWFRIEKRVIIHDYGSGSYQVSETDGSRKFGWAIPVSSILCAASDVAEGTTGFVGLVEEKNNMTKQNPENMPVAVGFVEMTKSDLEEGAYRAATRQISKGTRAMLASFLKAQGVKKSAIKAICDLLDTQWGLGMVSWGLGLVLTYAPHLKDDATVKILAKEFRVEAAAIGIDTGLDKVREQFMPMIMAAVANLPKPPAEKLRIAEEETKKARAIADECRAEVEVAAVQEVVSPPKVATA